MQILTVVETTTTGVPTTTEAPPCTQRLLGIRIGEASHLGPRGKGKRD